jgi:hypothetical protein
MCTPLAASMEMACVFLTYLSTGGKSAATTATQCLSERRLSGLAQSVTTVMTVFGGLTLFVTELLIAHSDRSLVSRA